MTHGKTFTAPRRADMVLLSIQYDSSHSAVPSARWLKTEGWHPYWYVFTNQKTTNKRFKKIQKLKKLKKYIIYYISSGKCSYTLIWHMGGSTLIWGRHNAIGFWGA
jgi:hypothetical protein